MRLESLESLGESRRDAARRALLYAAIEVFGDKALKGASVRDIARKAGQNIASIAYYFGSKEGLYHATITCIVQELRLIMADEIRQIRALRERSGASATSAEALKLLQAFLRGIYLRLLCRKEIIYLARLVIREQTQPSAGFEILYQQAFRDFHEGLCFLTGRVLGADPTAPQTIIRTHSLMGQVWFFAISRETILRRLGWKTLEGDNAELVADILMENVKLVLLGTVKVVGRKGKRA